MEIVVDTSLIVETSWLPELRNIVCGVVIVKDELTQIAN